MNNCQLRKAISASAEYASRQRGATIGERATCFLASLTGNLVLDGDLASQLFELLGVEHHIKPVHVQTSVPEHLKHKIPAFDGDPGAIAVPESIAGAVYSSLKNQVPTPGDADILHPCRKLHSYASQEDLQEDDSTVFISALATITFAAVIIGVCYLLFRGQ